MYAIKIVLLRTCSLIVLTISSFYGIAAQSTVFNIPSTDIQTTRHLYVEADFMTHLSSFESGGYQAYGPRLIYGLNKRAEVGVNAFFVRTSPAEPVEIQPNFKVRVYENEGSGVSVATGMIGFVPVTHRSENPMRAMIYSVASKQLKGFREPRFTAGAYSLVGRFAEETTRHGVLLGYEQPLTSKVTFAVDWSSGNNDYGYSVAGVGISLTRRSALYAGYNFGNQGRGNNALGVFYTFSF